MKQSAVRSLLARDPAAACMQLAIRHGGFVKLPAPEKQGLWVVSHPDALHEILVSPQGRFDKGGVFYQIIGRALGEGIFTTNDPELWVRLHAAMWPALRRHNLAQMSALATTMWQRRMDGWNVQKPVMLFDEFRLFSIELLGAYLFGANVDTRHMIQLAERVFAGMAGRIFVPTWFPGGRRYATAIKELLCEIDRIIANATGNDTLIATLKQGGFTDSQLRDQAVTMLMAGHDSTATVLVWAFIRLSERPQLYQSLRAANDINALAELFQAVAHDHPAFPMFPRNVVHDTTLMGHQLRAGDQIVVAPIATHHDPRLWHGFDDFYSSLQRGLTTDERKGHLPFGKGKRKCIGEDFAIHSAVIVLQSLLREFRKIKRPDDNSGERSRYHMTAPPYDGGQMWLVR